MPTIHEVAAACGVSARTVSRVINDRAHVRADTRAKVRAVAERMGYRPDPNARALQSGRKQLIGIIANAVSSDTTLTRIEVVSKLFNAAGYAVLVQFADSDAQESAAIGAVAPRCDALVVFTNLHNPTSPVLDQLHERGYPFLLVDPPQATAYPAVHLDRRTGYRDAVRYLAQKGKKHPLLLIEEFRSAERLAGFKEGLAAAGLAFTAESVLSTGKGFAGGLAAADRVEERIGSGRADAVLCHNDKIALGLLRGLSLRQLRVPEDLALIGFDDDAFGAFVNPPLTTIAPGGGDVGAFIFEQIRNRIEYASPVAGWTFGTGLIIRGSA